MKSKLTKGFSIFLAVGSFFAATARADQAQAEEAVTLAQQLCLVGDEYRFSVNAQGDLTIKKLEPGAEIKAVVVKSSNVGALTFDDEKVRALVQEDIRKCSLDAFKTVYSSLNKPAPNRPLYDLTTHDTMPELRHFCAGHPGDPAPLQVLTPPQQINCALCVCP